MPSKKFVPFFDIDPERLQKTEVATLGEVYFKRIGNSFSELSVGQGEFVFRSDERGMWLGAKDFENAPFRVSMEGEGTLSNLNVGGSNNLMPDKYSSFEYWTHNTSIGTVVNGTAVAFELASYAYEGTKYLRMVASAADNYVWLGTSSTNYNIPVEADTTYIISMYCRSDAGANGAVYVKDNADASANLLGTFNAGATWVRKSFTYTTKSTTTLLLLRIDNDTSGKILHVDAIQVEKSLYNTNNPSKYGVSSGSGEVNADRINAGTITGRTLQTAVSGKRVVVSGADNNIKVYDSSALRMMLDNDELTFYDSNGTQRLQIYSSGLFSYMDCTSTYGLIFDKEIQLADGLRSADDCIVNGDIISGGLFSMGGAVGNGVQGLLQAAKYSGSPVTGNYTIEIFDNGTYSYITTSHHDLVLEPAGGDVICARMQINPSGTAGNRLKIGDDGWFRDINTANTIGVYDSAGTGWGRLKAAGFDIASSEEYKKDVKSVDTKNNILNDFKSLRYVNYKYLQDEKNPYEGIEGKEDKAKVYNKSKDRVLLGLLAEEAPEQIRTPDGKGIDLAEYVNYIGLALQNLIHVVEQSMIK